MHDTYASKPKPKPVNTSRLGNRNPNHTQPITANYTKLGFKPYQSTTSFVSTFFFSILAPAPEGGALYHFLLEVVPFQSIFVQT